MSTRATVFAFLAGASVLAAGAAQATTTIFLDRCAETCTFMPGFDDSRTDTSSLVTAMRVLSAFPYGDGSWDAVVACVRDAFAPFDAQVTDVDPSSAPHLEIAVAGTSLQLGLSSGLLNVSPTTCDGDRVVDDGIGFAFATTLGDAPLDICWNAAQAAGALLGLDHEVLAGDVMTYLPGSLPKSFVDQDASCGEFAPRDCQCGGTTQNSHQQLVTTVPEPGVLGGAAALAALALRRRAAGAAPS